MTLPTTTSAPPFSAAATASGFGSVPPFPRPVTFEQRFCSHHQTDAAEFRRFVFQQCLPARLRFLAALINTCRPTYFACDRRLIDELAKARCVEDVQLDLHDFRLDPANHRFLRRTLRLRVSSERAIALARNYLPQRYGDRAPRATRAASV